MGDFQIGGVKIDPGKDLSLHDAYCAISAVLAKMHFEPEANPAGIIGQEEMVRFLLFGLLSGNHILLEGNPGLAKTETCKRLSRQLGLQFNRIQFVPDMMPSDLLGSKQFDVDASGRLIPMDVDGPIFCNLLLADEINRASSKVQAATLEATGERQVSRAGRGTVPIRTKQEREAVEVIKNSAGKMPFGFDRDRITDRSPLVFSLLATMNPIEMEGTYLLSEAQLDRFMAKVLVPYPTIDELSDIQRHEKEDGDPPAFDARVIFFLSALREKLLGRQARLRFTAENAWIAEQIRWLTWFSHLRPFGGGGDEGGAWAGDSADAVASAQARQNRLLLRTWAGENNPARKAFAGRLITSLSSDAYPGVVSGSSPRGMDRLTEAVILYAFIHGHMDPEKGVVHPEEADLDEVVTPILRHRIRLNSAAAAAGRTSDEVVEELMDAIREAREAQPAQKAQ